MKRMIILAVALLAVSTPVWANPLLYTTGQIGLCNPYIMSGGCIPTAYCPIPIPIPTPCPIPNPCPPMGSCQVTSSVVTINSCLMSGPCGVIGMQNVCTMTSQIGCNPCVQPVVMQCLTSLNMNGHTMVLGIGIP